MFIEPFEYFTTYRESIGAALNGIREESYNRAYGTLADAGLLVVVSSFVAMVDLLLLLSIIVVTTRKGLDQ